MFNGHKGDGDSEGELAEGDNGKGDCENGEGNRIVGKGQRVVLKGEWPGEGEPDFFVSPISLVGTAFTINTKCNKHNFFHYIHNKHKKSHSNLKNLVA